MSFVLISFFILFVCVYVSVVVCCWIFSFLNTTHEVDGQEVCYTVVYDVNDDKIISINIQLREWETLFMCPYTFKFRTRPLPGTASGMTCDCPRQDTVTHL